MTTDPQGASTKYAYNTNGGHTKHQKRHSHFDPHYVSDGRNVLQEADAAGATIAQYTDGPGMWGNLTSLRRGNDSAFYGYASGETNALMYVRARWYDPSTGRWIVSVKSFL